MGIYGLLRAAAYRIMEPDYGRKLFEIRRRLESPRCGRLMRWLLLFRMNRIMRKSGSFISLGARFDAEPVFPHGLNGIFVSNSAVIGAGAVIFQQVTIGSNALSDSQGYGAPQIGKNCYIGAGAKIIGNVRIGDNVRIGANCVVVRDVPDNCTVVLERPRIILKEKNENAFVPFQGQSAGTPER